MYIKAIPTEYAGYMFRSRLEARWAAFFDLLGWEWEYEPFDLNGYIPDFILTSAEPILVEVKPALNLNDLQKHFVKIKKSGWIGYVLIVGATLFNAIENYPLVIGSFYRIREDPNNYLLSDELLDQRPDRAIFAKCSDCKKISISYLGFVRNCNCHYSTCRICSREIWDRYGGNPFFYKDKYNSHSNQQKDLLHLWGKAHQITQKKWLKKDRMN